MPRPVTGRDRAVRGGGLSLAGLAAAALLLLSMGQALAADLTVQPRQVEDRKSIFATVASVHTTEARPRISGTITKLSVTEGDKVAAGQVIALVQDPKLPLQLAAMDARLKSLASQREQSAADLKRIRALRASGTVAQARLEESQTRYDVVVGEIAALTAERAAIVQQEREGEVLAPISGRVLKVPVTLGMVVRPGETVAVIASDTYVLRLLLPERHARFIKDGDKVLVGARGLGPTQEAVRTGTVSKVYPELQQGRVVADVTVSGIGDFFVGERTRVWVKTGEREAIVIPKDYVFWRFGVAYVRLKDGTEVVVQPGTELDGGLEILSGLKAGDVLVQP